MSEQKNSQKTESGAAAPLNYRLPSDVTMKHASKLAIVEDKPIMLDYWTPSLDKKALVGAKDNSVLIKYRGHLIIGGCTKGQPSDTVISLCIQA